MLGTMNPHAGAADLISDVRSGRIEVSRTAALSVIADWRDEDGSRLEAPVAAVELLTVLRSAVAVAWFVTFTALALDDQPQWRARLRQDVSGEAAHLFAHEVRRIFPFAPMLAARARADIDWQHTPSLPGRRKP